MKINQSINQSIVGETLERLRARLAGLSGPVSLTFHNPAVVDTELAVAAASQYVGKSFVVENVYKFPTPRFSLRVV